MLQILPICLTYSQKNDFLGQVPSLQGKLPSRQGQLSSLQGQQPNCPHPIFSQHPLTGSQSIVFTNSCSTGHTGFRCVFPNITHLWWWLKIPTHLIPKQHIMMRHLKLNQIPTMHFTKNKTFYHQTNEPGVKYRPINIMILVSNEKLWTNFYHSIGHCRMWYSPLWCDTDQ